MNSTPPDPNGATLERTDARRRAVRTASRQPGVVRGLVSARATAFWAPTDLGDARCARRGEERSCAWGRAGPFDFSRPSNVLYRNHGQPRHRPPAPQNALAGGHSNLPRGPCGQSPTRPRARAGSREMARLVRLVLTARRESTARCSRSRDLEGLSSKHSTHRHHARHGAMAPARRAQAVPRRLEQDREPREQRAHRAAPQPASPTRSQRGHSPELRRSTCRSVRD